MIKVLIPLVTLGCCVGLATVVQVVPPSQGMACLNNSYLFSSTPFDSHRTDSLPQSQQLYLSVRHNRPKKQVQPFNPFGKRRGDYQVIV